VRAFSQEARANLNASFNKEASTHESITNHSDEEVYSEQLHPGMYALVDPAVETYARIDPAELDEWYPWSASYNASKLAYVHHTCRFHGGECCIRRDATITFSTAHMVRLTGEEFLTSRG
jgi:hypothetical protein